MDMLSDMLTRIRNGFMSKKMVISVLYSKENINVLNVLQEEGYINSFKVVDISAGIKRINVELKYYKNRPVIKEIKRISKSSRRVYSKAKDVPKIYNGLGISVISTSKGVMSDLKARDLGVGGEILCSVF